MSARKTATSEELETKICESSRVGIVESASTNQKLKFVDSACQVLTNSLPFYENHRLLSRQAIMACYQSLILDVYTPLSNFILRYFNDLASFDRDVMVKVDFGIMGYVISY